MTKTPKFCSILLLSVGFLLCLSTSSFSSWPEFPLGSECLADDAHGTQSSPSVARGAANLFLVWDDERISTERDLFGARFTLAGEALDPAGLAVCTASGWQTSPQVAWGDQVYLVVWQDHRNGYSDVYGARVDSDGNVLDPDGFPICAGEWWAESPSVAWDDTNFLVVWSDDRDLISHDVYGTRINPDGAVLDGNGFRISSGSFREIGPSVSFNGQNYLVAWEVEGG